MYEKGQQGRDSSPGMDTNASSTQSKQPQWVKTHQLPPCPFERNSVPLPTQQVHSY